MDRFTGPPQPPRRCRGPPHGGPWGCGQAIPRLGADVLAPRGTPPRAAWRAAQGSGRLCGATRIGRAQLRGDAAARRATARARHAERAALLQAEGGRGAAVDADGEEAAPKPGG